jgi:hypothetical protein
MEYDVNVYRDGRWWMIEVPSIDALTQARRVSEVKDQADSLIATHLDVQMSQIEIKVVSMKIDEVDALVLVEHVKAAREAAAKAEVQAREETREAVRVLTEHDAPMRDVGELLGVSHQRVAQLAR